MSCPLSYRFFITLVKSFLPIWKKLNYAVSDTYSKSLRGAEYWSLWFLWLKVLLCKSITLYTSSILVLDLAHLLSSSNFVGFQNIEFEHASSSKIYYFWSLSLILKIQIIELEFSQVWVFRAKSCRVFEFFWVAWSSTTQSTF